MKIIKITALWCSSCIIMNNRLEKIGKEYNFDIEELDYDFDDIEKYNVGNILPVLIIMNQNKEIGRLIGEKSNHELDLFFKGIYEK